MKILGLYEQRILPGVIDLVMRHPVAQQRRAALVPRAHGRVLELGIGSGHNLVHYGRSVERLDGVDPSERLLAMTERKLFGLPFAVSLHAASAEALPFAAATFDTVVTTWTLCSIPDVAAALREARRVLKPHGELLFVEHGASPDAAVLRWQQRLNPVWNVLAGGCHLDRPAADLIRAAGLRIDELSAAYLEGPRFMTYTYEGLARPS